MMGGESGEKMEKEKKREGGGMKGGMVKEEKELTAGSICDDN